MEFYRKLIVALAGVAAAIGTALADWNVDAQEWGVILGAVAVAYGVYKLRNTPPGEVEQLPDGWGPG